jgi:hypothetical protein
MAERWLSTGDPPAVKALSVIGRKLKLVEVQGRAGGSLEELARGEVQERAKRVSRQAIRARTQH